MGCYDNALRAEHSMEVLPEGIPFDTGGHDLTHDLPAAKILLGMHDLALNDLSSNDPRIVVQALEWIVRENTEDDPHSFETFCRVFRTDKDRYRRIILMNLDHIMRRRMYIAPNRNIEARNKVVDEDGNIEKDRERIRELRARQKAGNEEAKGRRGFIRRSK